MCSGSPQNQLSSTRTGPKKVFLKSNTGRQSQLPQVKARNACHCSRKGSFSFSAGQLHQEITGQDPRVLFKPASTRERVILVPLGMTPAACQGPSWHKSGALHFWKEAQTFPSNPCQVGVPQGTRPDGCENMLRMQSCNLRCLFSAEGWCLFYKSTQTLQ